MDKRIQEYEEMLEQLKQLSQQTLMNIRLEMRRALDESEALALK